MAREGLLLEIDRAVEDLYGIAASQKPKDRDELTGVVKRLEEARAAYPFTGVAELDGLDRGFDLSPEADEACVALSQFATVDRPPGPAYISFSSDLTGANLLTDPERAHHAALQGITVARVPVSRSLDEARANLVAGLAWQLEWATALLVSATSTDGPTYKRRIGRLHRHLFGCGTSGST